MIAVAQKLWHLALRTQSNVKKTGGNGRKREYTCMQSLCIATTHILVETSRNRRFTHGWSTVVYASATAFKNVLLSSSATFHSFIHRSTSPGVNCKTSSSLLSVATCSNSLQTNNRKDDRRGRALNRLVRLYRCEWTSDERYFTHSHSVLNRAMFRRGRCGNGFSESNNVL